MANSTNIHTEALVVQEPGGEFVMKPVILDEVRSDEVLVEMQYSGICHTVSHSHRLANTCINCVSDEHLGCPLPDWSASGPGIPSHLWP
jgi:hypothetical protein